MPKTSRDLEATIIPQLVELGAQVKRLREFRRLTLHVLAAQADIGVQTLVRIEEGSPGVALLNLQKVLTVLGRPATFLDASTPPGDARPLLALHAESEAVRSRVQRAAQLACQELDKLGRKDGVTFASEAFVAALEQRMLELLRGDCGLPLPAAAVPPKALYSNPDVGGPLLAEGTKPAGWALRLRHSRQVLSRSGAVLAGDSLDASELYPSRAAALEGLGAYVETHGHTPGAVDAVPVFRDGGTLRF